MELPQELLNVDHWQLCKVTPSLTKSGKFDKMPFKPKFHPYLEKYNKGGFAWEHCRDVKRWLEKKNMVNGEILYGFHLKDSGFSVIDLDDFKKTNEHQWEMLKKYRSYIERSISGAGLHIWIKGTGTNKKDAEKKIEFYSNQFIAVTGKHVKGSPMECVDYQDAIATMWPQETDMTALIEEIYGCPIGEIIINKNTGGSLGLLKWIEQELENRGMWLKEHKNKWYISNCLWEAQHGNLSTGPTDAYFFLNEEGRLAYSCSHTHCKGKGIKAVKNVLSYES